LLGLVTVHAIKQYRIAAVKIFCEMAKRWWFAEWKFAIVTKL